MGELRVVQVDFAEAKCLADLASIFQDLSFTVQASERLLSVVEDESQDPILIQSLWTAALISYVRCFAHGKRFGLSEETISHLEGNPIEVHRFYKNLRDKHIAHSVNPFEEVAVGLVLPEEGVTDRAIQGVATLSRRYIAASREGVEQLVVLASALREEVGRLAKEAKAETLQVGKQIPLEKLLRKPRLRVVAPGSEQAGLPRN